jgi:hypothetical protein
VREIEFLLPEWSDHMRRARFLLIEFRHSKTRVFERPCFRRQFDLMELMRLLVYLKAQ